jgi:DNA-binding LacI/PurR family transcriptional regulator
MMKRRKVDTTSLLPRYAQARQYLEDLIQSTPYGPGDQLPSERELAATFRVSQMTMNRAIQEMVRDGILYREVGRGTFVVHQDRRPRRNGTLGLVTLFSPGIVRRNYYASEILRGVHEAAGHVHRDLMLIHEPLHQTEGMVSRLHGRADGFLMMSPPDEALPAIRSLRAEGIPVLAVGSSWPGEDIPAVDSDNILGAHQAVEFIASRGHQRIGLIGGPEDLSNSRDRHVGFAESMREAGLQPREDWTLLSESASTLTDAEKRRIVQISKDPAGPTAFFAAGYELAVRAIEALQREGLRVPEDISIVGFDDTFSAAFLNPPLTTVVQPLGSMGVRAVQRLDAMLRGETDEGQGQMVERLPTYLVVRGSCAEPASRM